MICLLTGMVAGHTSCIREEFNSELINPSIQFSPGVAAPIGSVHYRLEELFMDSLAPDEFTVDRDGFITMRYSEDIASIGASDLFVFSDISFSERITNTTGLPIVLDGLPRLDIQDTIRIPVSIPAAPNAEVDSIILDSLELMLSATSPFNGNINIQPFGAFAYLNEPNNPLQITGTTLKLEHFPPDRNELVIVYRATITTPSGTILPGGEILNLDIGILNIRYYSVYGYLGQFTIPVQPQSIAIGLFDPIPGGSFHFEDATLQINTANSFGIPVQVATTQLQATSRDGQTVFITGSAVPDIPNPWLIHHPGIGHEGQSAYDSLLLTTSNTNLFHVLETSPGELSYGITGTCNPAGTDHSNFLLDSSRITAGATLKLPIYGYADLLLIQDTLDFIFDDFYENPPEEIKSLTFRLNFINGLPVDIGFQVYFLDGSGTRLDSLFNDLQDPLRLVPGATDTNGDGKADPRTADPIEIVIDRDRIDNISSTRYLFLEGRFTTVGFDNEPPGNVRFFTDYFFTAHLGVIAELDVNSSGF